MIHLHFILPVQGGLFAMDASLIIVAAILLAGGILYKYRENISFNDTNLRIDNKMDNSTNNSLKAENIQNGVSSDRNNREENIEYAKNSETTKIQD